MNNERVFKYSSVLYHMFLYYQPDRFHFPLQKLDTKGQPKSVIFWTPLFHKYESPYTYSYFIDSFVHLVMIMLKGSPSPRINPKIKRVLQLSKQSKVGDWYLYFSDRSHTIHFMCPFLNLRVPPWSFWGSFPHSRRVHDRRGAHGWLLLFRYLQK